MSLVHQFNFSKIRLLKIKLILRIIVISSGISGNVSAQSLDKYCLSTVGQIETANKKARVFDPTPPLPYFIDSVENLPELHSQPCHKFYRFVWGECERKTFFSYSPTLNKAFIQGHRRTDWGGDFVHLEISESGTKSVPEALISSGFVEDVPALNGALFQGRSKGEALFYDGDKVTNISNYFPQSKNRKQGLRWYPIQTFNGRVFLAVDFIRTKDYPLIMELKSGLKFRFIPIPKKLKNASWLELYTLHKDSQLWGLSRNVVVAEIGNTLKSVVIIPPSFSINSSIYTGQLLDGSIQLQIKQESTGLKMIYFLRKASPTANCEIMLDLDKPVELSAN